MVEKVQTAVTTKSLRGLLPTILKRITVAVQEQPEVVLAAWESLIGERFAPMAQAVSFQEGILTVKVKNSSLLSLLSQYQRLHLLKKLRTRFPGVEIHNIRFCIG